MEKPKWTIRQALPEGAGRIHELHDASVRTLCSSHYSTEVIDGWLFNRSPEGYLASIQRGDIFVIE